MMLSTKGRYAVMAMVDLAQMSQGTPVSLAEIAARQEITLSYLEQIFARLRRAKLIFSVRGPGGGYVLAREMSDITVRDIISAVQESTKMTRCDHSDNGCLSDKSRCLTHGLWAGLEEQIDRYLESISLEDICQRRIRKHEGDGLVGDYVGLDVAELAL